MWREIACGPGHTFAISSEGNVSAWGCNQPSFPNRNKKGKKKKKGRAMGPSFPAVKNGKVYTGNYCTVLVSDNGGEVYVR